MDEFGGRREFLTAAGAVGLTALAGCSGGEQTTVDPDAPPSERLTAYLTTSPAANNFEETIVDATGQDRVVIEVGAGNGRAYAPAAVRVSAGTTLSWQWTGSGGSHNVQSASNSDFEFSSGPAKLQPDPFERTFDEPGVGRYYCTPHRGVGMKAGFIVESE